MEITRRGRPVVVIVSREEFERLRSTERPLFADAYRAFLSKFLPLAEVGLDADFRRPSGIGPPGVG